jgi:hypothetical protein
MCTNSAKTMREALAELVVDNRNNGAMQARLQGQCAARC